MITDSRHPWLTDVSPADLVQPEPADPWPPAGFRAAPDDPENPWSEVHLEPAS